MFHYLEENENFKSKYKQKIGITAVIRNRAAVRILVFSLADVSNHLTKPCS
jgi:hypothetical protein